MAEEYLIIDGEHDNKIWGLHRKAGSKKLVIHIHGMTHSMHHMLEVSAADYFSANGYDHYRMSLYGREPGSRNLVESNLSTQLSDLRAIFDHFSGRYDDIYVCAHSLGGLLMLILNPPNIKALSLWDPATDITHFWSTADFLTYMPERKQYQLNYGNVFAISESFVEEIKLYPNDKCLELAANINTPAQMIIPELSIFLASPHAPPQGYEHAFAGAFELVNTPNSNHVFSLEGNAYDLFKNTRRWFDEL